MTNKKKDVLVTGGTGFIGRHLVKKLVNSGYQVKILTRQAGNPDAISGKQVSGGISYIQGDIGNLDDVVRASVGVEVIFHLASAMSGSWEDYKKSTIKGMENVLQACKENSIKNLIYTSTINVYDAKNYPNGSVIDESFQYEDQPERRGSYSNAKLTAEKLLINNKYTFPAFITIIRPGLVYGDKKNFIPLDAGKVMMNRFIVIFGSGKGKLPVVYIENLVDALMLSADIEAGSERVRVLNIVDDDYPTQNEFISHYSSSVNRKFILIHVPVILLKLLFFLVDNIMFVVPRKKINLLYKLKAIIKTPVYSTENAKKTIKWHQKIDFENGMKYSLESVRRK